MNILLTGGSGFVGAALHASLGQHAVRRAMRTPCAAANDCVTIANIDPDTDWNLALHGREVVLHLAARAHVMQEHSSDPLATYRSVNTAGTLNLAQQAAAAGVRRFIFLSSVKVHGEATRPGQPFQVDAQLQPQDPYGISKHEAEQGLRQIAKATSMELVIIRPPLIYGPGVKANFAALLRTVARGIPLPLGALHNLRSLLALDNLIDFIHLCMTHPAAANQTFLVSDGDDISTPELIHRMAQALDQPTRLLPVPVWLLHAAAAPLGQRMAMQRLCGSLQVDISHARQRLGWRPPITLNEGLRRTVAAMPL
jgi:nucleoside-diphosphate-sugar epimerase